MDGAAKPTSRSQTTKAKVRLIAFYLPQFHPIPENDAWWGKGFTEWSNVAKARPLFPGHYQPHLPTDLGFYDLRVPEVRQAQADLAGEHNIHGFCYYHYWFHGRRLLERPFAEVLESGDPDFPFCLCWANENWTRRWDGLEQQILMEQTHSEQDDRAHIRFLMAAFHDPRYIRVDGRPLFLVYRVHALPDPRRTTDVWREEAARQGLPGLYLAVVEAWPPDRGDPEHLGFDAAVDFQPDWKNRPERIMPKRRPVLGYSKKHDSFLFNSVYSYSAMVDRMINRPEPEYTVFPGVTPGWDNSPRRKSKAMIFVGSTPGHYERWLRCAITHARRRLSGDEQIVFINGWNEWAEGNHLEPDARWGLQYLEATQRALRVAGVES